MPEFVLNRTHTHRSTLGHIINFEKGVPTYVPPALVKEVLAIGADPVEDTDVQAVLLGPDGQPAKVELTAEERKAAMLAAFPQLEFENNRTDFTAGGNPRPDAIARFAGFIPTNKERDEAWREYRQAQTTGEGA